MQDLTTASHKMALLVVINKGNLNRYESVIRTLTELIEQGYGRASGLLSLFDNGAIYLGLIMGQDVIDLLEILNKCL